MAMQKDINDGAGTMSLPEIISASWATNFGRELEQATWRGPGALRSLLPLEVALNILQRATVRLKAEPTLVEVSNLHGMQLH